MTNRTSISKLAIAIGAGLLCFAPAAAQDETAPVAEVAPEAAADAMIETVDADPALWIAEDEDTKIYMFGTIHMLKPGLSWFDDAVADAYGSADSVVFELLEPEPAEVQATVMRLAVDSSGTSLRDKLSDKDRADYEAALTEFGIPAPQLDQLDPWMAAIQLSVFAITKAGFDPNSGVEKVLMQRATSDSKEMIGLETLEEQLGFMDNLPLENQVAFLNATVDQLDDIEEGLDAMIGDWADGDPQALADLLNEALTDAALRDALLTQRNANWAEWIDTRLDTPGTVFLAVGAGHLAGESSVQDLLAERGIESRRIEY